VGGAVHYDEGVLFGYRWFDERRLRPAFPFGFGLSYSRFAFGELHVRRAGRGAGVSFTVRNAGARPGVVVPQLYLGLPGRRGRVQPPRALKAFARVSLRPHRARRVRLRLSARDFSYWDARRHRWRIAPGCYRVEVGSSSRRIQLTRRICR
jgi:beta-glucosidase